MNGIIKGMLIILVILYVISPLDAVPGPVDDIIVALLGIALQRKTGKGKAQKELIV